MKKRNFWRGVMSMMMALVMCLSLPLSVLAEEGTVEVETTGGNPEPVNVTITIEAAPQSDGSVQTNTTTTAQAEITASGMIVDFQGQSSMTADPAGTVTGDASTDYFVSSADGSYNADGGSETTLASQSPTGTVDVPLTTEPGENQSTISGDPVGTTETTGDVPTGETDGIYDYQTETITQQGSVSITTTAVEVTENSELDMNYRNGDAAPNGENDLFDYGSELMTDEEIKNASEEGYSHMLVGSNIFSRYTAALISKEQDPSFVADEEPVFIKDGVAYYAQRNHTSLKNGGFVTDGFYLDGEYVDEEVIARWDYIQRFVFVDQETGEMFTAYCVDQQTTASYGYNYNVENLEDADYYTEENAAKIRAVAVNGYWGNESGKGSLEELKKTMTASGQFTEEEVAAVTDGIAMTATQYAIWTFSNEENGDDFISAYYVKEGKTRPGALAEGQEKDVDLIFKLTNFLTNLEPENPQGTTADTMINQENFLEDLSVTVIGKAEDHANNQDDQKDNDAYHTDITFALKVTPSGKDGESMLVEVIDGDGKTLAKGRISGELQDGEVQLTKDENDNYTFKNIVLTEGNQNFNINLSGVQHLEEGVYLYTSEIKENESSQTMVGVASGKRSYQVSMNIEFDLSVEDEVVATENVWRTEWTNEIPTPEENDNPPATHDDDVPVPEENQDPPAPEQNEDTPATFRLRRNVGKGLTEIDDEEVPLAKAPKTGDSSLILAAISVLTGMGFAGVGFTTRRKEQ